MAGEHTCNQLGNVAVATVVVKGVIWRTETYHCNICGVAVRTIRERV